MQPHGTGHPATASARRQPEVADKVQTSNVVNPDSFSARLERPKEMDKVAHLQMLDVRSISLEGRGDRGAIRSLVIADVCFGPSEAYLSEGSY